MKIHHTAIVDKKAQIDHDVEIGAYSIIGPHVTIKAGTKVRSHVVIEGYTSIGERCSIFPGACLGMTAQDRKAQEGAVSYLEIGDDNIIREHVTMHTGSPVNSKTIVGDRNFLMANTHVGHNCELGNDIMMANGAVLGGYVCVEDKVVLGGFAGIHQHSRIGMLSIVGGQSKGSKNVPPFSICDGNPMKFFGVNSVGLKRAEFSSARCLDIKKALKTLFASNLSLKNAVQKVQEDFDGNSDIAHLIQFIEKSDRVICRA